MADDINPGRRAELEAALVVLEPEIRGLDDLALVSVSPDLRAKITEESNILKHRRDLIQAELDAMDACDEAHDALLADGYPAMPPASLIDSLYAELQEQKADIEAAVAVFSAMATSMSISLGTPEPKP